jgi:purine catabolism regulator
MLVSDLLERTDLRLRLIVRGDLSRHIRWVHSSELRNPAPYLRGGEVVLSSGVWYVDDASVERFVGGLAESGVAALGFGTHAELPVVPPAVVRAAESKGITLFEVPDDVPFLVVTEAFVEASMASHERPLRESASRNAELVRSLQGGQGLEALLRVLTRAIPGSAAVVAGDRVLARVGPTDLPSQVVSAILNSADGAIADAGYVAYPIPGGPATVFLVVPRHADAPSIDERAAVDQVVAFLAIELQRLRSIRENGRRYAAELFDLIDAGAHEYSSTVARMRSLGLAPNEPMVVACVEGPDQERALRHVEAWLDTRPGPNVAGVKTGQVLVLLPVAAQVDLDALAAELYAGVGGDLLVGVGSVARDARGIRDSAVEARHACRFAARRRDIGYATHDSLASHAVLLATQPDQTLARFEDALLGPLVAHDAKRQAGLIDTLYRFLSSSGHFRETADDLHIHVNTLRQRLKRVEELTGRDLSKMDDKVDFWLALRARSLREERARAERDR